MSVRRLLAAAAVAASVTASVAAPVLAHEGHAHGGEEPKPVVAMAAPTLETSSADFELVAVAQGRILLVYLDRFTTNEPVNGAVVEITADGEAMTASPVSGEEGVYRLEAGWLSKPGAHDLTVSITAADASDLLIGTLEIPATAAVATATGTRGGVSDVLARVRQDSGLLLGAAMVFLLGVLTTVALTQRGRPRAVAGAVLIGLGLLLAGGTAFAHGDEDHGQDDKGKSPAAIPSTAPTGASESPRRLPDGSLYVPKPSQRLLSIRTTVARSQEAARTVQLIGQIAADPNGGGHVQATQIGRIEPGDKGLPYVGQRVEAGQILAYIAAAVNIVDRSGIQQQIAIVEQELVIAESRLQRLRKLEGSVPQRDIEEAEATLNGLRKRRAALSPTLTTKEALRAPISGIVTANNVKVGQVIDGRDQVLFEIVDPARLMIEAVAFDPRVANTVHMASATTADGVTLALEHLGHSLALRQQAIPLLFRIIAPPQGLAVGQPVRIVAQIQGMASGIVLPRKSVVRSGSGQPIVWQHESPQRFVARPVRTQPVDANTVLVLAGVEPEARIVTDGAGLLNQVR
ncbi:HlyD family efflux transporter periplasmic adaptor subunit [Azospirillum sp. RWY-5-1]|uniref:HlyD family efflux transporter periplasmic adaptor subunit n=1 Tax=Azospirillum oleiclasticum TaxID=2735135 RepID=A0ABX2TG74_9PROT|nr:HlyD family efflux transporter periplasmic adaptor subunit [Azospirillum oleiclasticum]NYZ14837.1 HlyD family efflux transporter periplasmic adaptor subunit [Azospirillum oleiclasticum]NYZ22177.1 HlyD family efflux transporter periplasmic adaptor subunit [Azospirillum oleiclasticum]